MTQKSNEITDIRELTIRKQDKHFWGYFSDKNSLVAPFGALTLFITLFHFQLDLSEEVQITWRTWG
jgi:hypothetical protein